MSNIIEKMIRALGEPKTTICGVQCYWFSATQFEIILKKVKSSSPTRIVTYDKELGQAHTLLELASKKHEAIQSREFPGGLVWICHGNNE